MASHILVPLDGSALAEAVLPRAVALARATAHTLTLLRVITPVAFHQPRIWRATASTSLHAQREETTLALARAALAAVAERLRGADVPVQTEVLEGDDVAATIVARAVHDPDVAMIAMATHGRSGPSRWVLGNVAANVLHATPTPLLLVGACDGAALHAPVAAYHTIVVPLDGSPLAEQALAPAQTIAAATRATLVLVAAVPAPDNRGLAEAGVVPFWMLADCQAEPARVATSVEDVAQRLAWEAFPVRPSIVFGPRAEAILSASVAEHADLIVMATHRRSGLPRLWRDSIAAKVVQGAGVPVVLVRARERQGQASRAPHTPAKHPCSQRTADAFLRQPDRESSLLIGHTHQRMERVAPLRVSSADHQVHQRRPAGPRHHRRVRADVRTSRGKIRPAIPCWTHWSRRCYGTA